MSEERLERIEHQLELLIQGMTTMNSRIDGLENRLNSLEGTLLTTMTEGFSSLHSYQLDLDRDLAINEQKTEDNARKSRRLNQRLMRIEQRYDDF